MSEPVTKRVLMSEELFEALGASRVDWGEPDTHGFYTPTIYGNGAIAALHDIAEAAKNGGWAMDHKRRGGREKLAYIERRARSVL